MGESLIIDVGILSRGAAGQVTAVIGPDNIERSGPGVCLIVVTHVSSNYDIASELRQRCRIAHSGAGRKCNCRTGDGANATVVLKQIVINRVLLAAIIEDAYPVAGRRDYYVRLPLVRSGSIVVYYAHKRPGTAAVQ